MLCPVLGKGIYLNCACYKVRQIINAASLIKVQVVLVKEFKLPFIPNEH